MSSDAVGSFQEPRYIQSYDHLENNEKQKYIHIYFTDFQSSKEFANLASSTLLPIMKVSQLEKEINIQDGFDAKRAFCVQIDYSKVEKTDKVFQLFEPLLRNIPKAKENLNRAFRNSLEKSESSERQWPEEMIQAAPVDENYFNDILDVQFKRGVIEIEHTSGLGSSLFKQMAAASFRNVSPIMETKDSENGSILSINYQGLPESDIYKTFSRLIFTIPNAREMESLQFLKEYLEKDEDIGEIKYPTLREITFGDFLERLEYAVQNHEDGTQERTIEVQFVHAKPIFSKDEKINGTDILEKKALDEFGDQVEIEHLDSGGILLKIHAPKEKVIEGIDYLFGSLSFEKFSASISI